MGDEAGETLGERHRQVLALAAKGYTNDQIANELQIAPATVKTHLERARRRLGALNTTHAVALALVAGQLVQETDEHWPDARSMGNHRLSRGRRHRFTVN